MSTTISEIWFRQRPVILSPELDPVSALPIFVPRWCGPPPSRPWPRSLRTCGPGWRTWPDTRQTDRALEIRPPSLQSRRRNEGRSPLLRKGEPGEQVKVQARSS